MTRQRRHTSVPPEARAVLIGTLISLAVSILLCAFFAWIISGEYLQQNWIGYGAMVTLLLSAALGSMTSVIIAKSKRLMIASITSVSYYLSLLGINILFFDGKLQGMWETALVVIAGTGLVILGGLKERKPHKNRAAKTKIVKLYKKH